MPQAYERFAIALEGVGYLTEPADGESFAEQVFAPWGQFEAYRQEERRDAEAAMRQYLGKHPEIDPAKVAVVEIEVEYKFLPSEA